MLLTQSGSQDRFAEYGKLWKLGRYGRRAEYGRCSGPSTPLDLQSGGGKQQSSDPDALNAQMEQVAKMMGSPEGQSMAANMMKEMQSVMT